jgi:uncharacterized protein
MWLLCIGVWAAQGASDDLNLPAIPEDRYFVQDYADMLPSEGQRKLGQLQQEAFEEHDTPIIVVTVESMARYGGKGYSIERFAAAWFNHWQIGKRGEAGELINQGILLLVSRGDRKARIELGDDWGRRWDKHCARIMQDRIISRFKQGDFAEGIIAGVEALAEMAAKGPEAEPPQGLPDFLPKSLEERPLATTPLPVWGMGLMVIGGIAMIVLSFLMPQYRKWLLIVGIGLIVAAFVLYIILAIVAIFMRSRSGGGGGGGFSGGGFGSGGFSGGGGATGSW